MSTHRLYYDDSYLQNFQEFCKQLRDQAGGMKVDYHLMRTDEPVEKALGIYLTKRQNRV